MTLYSKTFFSLKDNFLSFQTSYINKLYGQKWAHSNYFCKESQHFSYFPKWQLQNVKKIIWGNRGKSSCLKNKCLLGYVDLENTKFTGPFWPVWSLIWVQRWPKLAKMAYIWPKTGRILPKNLLHFEKNMIFGQFCLIYASINITNSKCSNLIRNDITLVILLVDDLI